MNPFIRLEGSPPRPFGQTLLLLVAVIVLFFGVPGFVAMFVIDHYAHRYHDEQLDVIRPRGREAGQAGVPAEANPYMKHRWTDHGDENTAWLEGWVEAKGKVP